MAAKRDMQMRFDVSSLLRDENSLELEKLRKDYEMKVADFMLKSKSWNPFSKGKSSYKDLYRAYRLQFPVFHILLNIVEGIIGENNSKYDIIIVVLFILILTGKITHVKSFKWITWLLILNLR